MIKIQCAVPFFVGYKKKEAEKEGELKNIDLTKIELNL